MTTSWQDIQAEIQKGKSKDKPLGDFDTVRRAKYNLVKLKTNRPLLVYASAFHLPHKRVFAQFLSLDLSDKEGFYEIIRNVNSSEVDIYIHSPGGSVEAIESIVVMLRSKFKTIRFIVTGAAKSAATMLVLAGNSILMDTAGELGPIDPQIILGNWLSPAGSVIEQFKVAEKELQKDPTKLPAWIPILEKYAPSLQIQCHNFLKLSKKLVRGWLNDYMFEKQRDSQKKARKIANFLANEKNTLSHARRVDAKKLKELGVKIELLEEQSPEFQDAIRQMHLAIMQTLEGTAAVKIFENSEGSALIQTINVQPQQPI